MSDDWRGKRIIVDLTRREIRVDHLTSTFLKRWVGGRGLNAAYLKERGLPPAGSSPDENVLLFAVGPMAGTSAPCSGQVHVSSVSPLSEPPLYGGAQCGGHFGAELKRAGYDQIVIEGKAGSPILLLISDGEIDIKDAGGIWGLDTLEATIAVQERMGDRRAGVACVGRAGERSAPCASILFDFSWGSGPLGFGSVMGSKNIKAIAVRGTGALKPLDADRFSRSCFSLWERMGDDPGLSLLKTEGTLLLMDREKYVATLGNRNFNGSVSGESMGNFSLERYKESFFHGWESCFGCPLHCRPYTHIREGVFEGSHFGGLHLEGVLALGPRLGIHEWGYPLKMFQMCQMEGIDPLNVGSALAWLVDCYERGLLPPDLLEGVSLSWGDEESLFRFFSRMVTGDGLGGLPLEGAFRAAAKVGRGCEDRVAHVSGLSVPAFDPRCSKELALASGLTSLEWDEMKRFAFSERDLLLTLHPSNRQEIESLPPYEEAAGLRGGAGLLKAWEERKLFSDLLGVCPFPFARLAGISCNELMELFNAMTGEDLFIEQLIGKGKEVAGVEQGLRIEGGWGRENALPSERFFREEVLEGKFRGTILAREEWEEALLEYYKLSGWDAAE